MTERDDRLALADGATLAYSIAPAHAAAPGRPPVLLLHGLASNRTRWTEFAAATNLPQRFDVLRIDLRGHGDSTTSAALTLERWCDDLAQLLAARGDARAIVIGHSLGAQVALAFAAHHRARCAAIGLIDPVFRAALSGRWRTIAALGPLFVVLAAIVRAANRLGLRRRVVVPYDLQALDRIARRALGSAEAERAFIREYSSTRADLQHFRTANYLQDLAEMFRPTPALQSIAVPVLALLSSGATFADPQAMARLLATLPDHRLVWIDCHHWPLTERPAEVRLAIERWCAALA